MKIALLTFLEILSIFTIFGMAQINDSLQKVSAIKPLVSTRDDIFKLFGRPPELDVQKLGNTYEFDDGRVTVIYSSGVCACRVENGIKITEGWNVPEWTVTSISFYPKIRKPPTELAIDLGHFSRQEVADNPGVFEYSNESLGVEYVVARGLVAEIHKSPPASLDFLWCSQKD